MADRELAIVLKVVNDQLVSGINQAENAVKNFATQSVSALDQVEERTENLRHVWKGLFEAFIGVEIVDALKRIAEAANDATEKLEIAARTAANFGHGFNPDELEGWLQKFAASAQGGGFQLPDIRQGVQVFSAIGLDEDQIKRATADAANLAAAYGFSFPEAVHIAQEALTGHVEMLTRYGVISREAAKNIHTVEQAMEAMEHASSGAAEERANGLAGAFGRLGNSVNLLSKAFGSQLIPYFDATANAIANVADAFSALPPWLQQAAAAISFLSLGLTALGLMLPAVKLGVEFLTGGFGLLGAILKTVVGGFGGVSIAAATTSDVMAALAAKEITGAEAAELLQASTIRSTGALGLLQTFIVGPLMSAFGGLVSILRTVITALAVDVVGADSAAAASFAAVASPVLAVIAVLAGLAAAAIALSGHWNDVMKAMSTAWDEFYTNVLTKANTLRRVLGDVMLMLSGPGGMAAGNADLTATLNVAMPKTTQWANQTAKAIGDSIVGAVKSAWSNIVRFFSGAAGSVVIPKDAFSGGIPGKGGNKDTAAKAAQDALKSFDEATKNWLDAFQARVDVAQAMVDASKAKLDAYAATLPNGKPSNAAEEERYQELLNSQIAAEKNLREATLQQHEAQVAAAAHYEEIAKSISPELKNHDALIRSALDAARQHNDQALRLWTTYQNLGVTLAQILATQRDIRNETANASGETLTQNARAKLDSLLNDNAAQVEAVQHARNLAEQQAGGVLPKAQSDAFEVQLAQLALAAAQAREEMSRYDLAVAGMVAATTHLQSDQQKAIDAYNAETAAHNATIAAENRLGEATDKLTKDLNDRKSRLTSVLDQLVQRLNIAGLTPNQQGSGFTFNPYQFILAAFEQTKSFADIMATVNQIVKVFVQLLDNLRPVIDIVLDALRAVANVFIFLYDVVARILRLFGIQLQIINSLNDAYGNIPLIQITHNIPTLNELAAGKLNNPLSDTPIGSNTLEGIGNTQVSLLQSILGAVLALVAIESIFGHGGGLFGFLGGIFGHGAGAGASSAGDTALQGALNAINTIPTDSISQGTQSALLADGSSTSGGLFTATNNAMQAAAPYLASAIGTVLGSAIGGGGGTSTLLGGLGSIVGTIFGGPVGGAIGGFLGGIFGGLFGGHKSAPSVPATKQTTEFTAMLHQSTDVHAWMNGLTTQASSMLQKVSTASNALMSAAQSIAGAAQAMTNNFNLNSNTHIGSVNLNNDLDVSNLGTKLAEAQMRRIRFTQFSIGRAPIG